MNVVLTGCRGSGKSSVGRSLAERLGRSFIDCDDHIEKKTRLTIREIFEKSGESGFRSIESEAIRELAKLDGKVIATGGGAVLKHGNMRVLKRHGSRIFFLDVDAETAFRRMQEDPSTRARRPALTGKDPFTEIREQIEFRRPSYLESADHVVRAEGRTVEQVVEEILKLLGPGAGERDDRETATA